MNILNDYKEKKAWLKKGKDYLIEICVRERMTEDEHKKYTEQGFGYSGRFVWNIYCYLYPKHKLFNQTTEESYESCPVNSLHGGCTFVKWHRDSNSNITSKQYGCDYGHYGDDDFSYFSTPNEAYRVFFDAEELIRELEVEEVERQSEDI